ncbi:MAG: tetratricopeptide repeat protein [Sphingobacteriales bacterium]|nr:MAG: tetratricopeptide repeat protein [Sphingobacteriales bacterium]
MMHFYQILFSFCLNNYRHSRMLILLLVLLTSPLFASAATGYDSLFHQSYAVRSVYFDQRVGVLTMPLSKSLPLLDALQKRAREEHDYAAELEVIIGRYQCQDEMEMPAIDKKIAGLEKLLHDLDKDKYPEYSAVIMNFLGNIYYGKKHDYTRAFDHFINACDIARQYSEQDFPDKKLLLVILGNRLYTMGDIEKARQTLLEADSLKHPWDKMITYNAENTLGLVYRSYRQYDKAMHYFEQARANAIADHNPVWTAITSGNIGITYYNQGEFDKAIPLLESDVKYCLSPLSSAADNGIKSLLILADIHLQRNDLERVASEIQLARNFLDSSRDRVKSLALFYPVVADYYFKKGDFRTASLYKDSAAVFKDSLEVRDNIYQLAKVEHKKDLERADVEIGQLSAEKKLLSFTRNGLIIGIALLCIITALIINRQQLKHRLKQEAMQGKKDQAEHDLMAATRQLEIFTRHLQEKNLLIEQSGQEIERLRTTLVHADAEQEHSEVLQQLYTATILTDDEWAEFKLLFDQVHKGYLQRLKIKMPELTPADTRFVVLSKLNLSNKEMAGILGVQVDTIRSYKHRLRKRFGLAEDANIKAFVDAI